MFTKRFEKEILVDTQKYRRYNFLEHTYYCISKLMGDMILI